MGIRHLKNLLSQMCKKSGVYHHPNVNDFITCEKNRLYRKMVATEKINNPVKQMQIRNSLKNKPYFVGIDAHLYALRYKRVFKRIEYGFLRQIVLTLSSKMIPVYVFDGSAPEQKKKTIYTRKNKKEKLRIKLENLLFKNINGPENVTEIVPVHQCELSIDELIEHINNIFNKIICFDNEPGQSQNDTSVIKQNNSDIFLYDINEKNTDYVEFIRLLKKSISIDPNDIESFKKFLDLLRIPYVTADNEADDLLAYLYKNDTIQACQSDDMDMLPKGCGNVIQVTNKGIVQYVLSEILQELHLNHNQFVDLCILLGSDYYDAYLPKIKAIELYDKFIKSDDPSIEDFVLAYSEEDPKILSYMENYKNVRSLFLVSNENPKQNKLNSKLSPMRMKIIIEYFNSVGICLNEKIIHKMNFMITHANNYIITTK